MHRYSENLPSSHPVSAIKAEGDLLLQSILRELRASQESSAQGTYDFAVAGRQIKRINALLALKYELPDEEWKFLVHSCLKMALAADVSIVRQTALLQCAGKLLGKRRAYGLIELEWRPFWELIQSGFLSHLNSRAKASNAVVTEYMRQLLYVTQVASRYFPRSAIAELAAVTGPSFAHVNSRAPFNTQAMLYVFLPMITRWKELPAGTMEYWVEVWASVNHCPTWDAVWTTIFCRLAHADVIEDAAYDKTTGALVPGSGFPWGQHVPFFASRLLDMLKVPVEGGKRIEKPYPYEAQALLNSKPDGVNNMVRLLVRLMTVSVPAGVSAQHGDVPPAQHGDVPPAQAQGVESLPGVAEVKVRPGTGDASALGHVERLLRALSSFFYPTSSHAGKMNTFVRLLTQAFAGRVGREAGVAAAQAVLASNGVPMPSILSSEGEVAGLQGGLSAGDVRAGGTKPITAALIDRFVDAVLPLSVMGLYSSGGSGTVWECAVTMKSLAAFAPARVAKELTNMATQALDSGSVNAAHQAPNALYALSILTPALLWPVPHLAPALPDLLHASLPGIDPNDANKTMATLAFFTSVVSLVAIVDADDATEVAAKQRLSDDYVNGVLLPAWNPASTAFTGVPVGGHIPEHIQGKVKPVQGAAAKHGLDSVPSAGRVRSYGTADKTSDDAIVTVLPGASTAGEEGGMDTTASAAGLAPALADTHELFTACKEAMPRISEWVVLLLERLFRILETREGAGAPKEAGQGQAKKGKSDSLGSSLHSLFNCLFQQCSPRLASSLLTRVVNWLRGCGVLESGKDVASLEQALVMAMPEQALAKLVPLHVEQITAPAAPEKIAVWHTRLLAGALKQAGPALLPHLPAIQGALRASLTHKELAVRKAGNKLLRWSLDTLLNSYETESRSHSPSDWAELPTLWRKWGQQYGWATTTSSTAPWVSAGLLQPGVSPSWHVPSQQEREAAAALLQEFLLGPLTRLDDFSRTYGPAPGAAPPAFGETTEDAATAAAAASASSSDTPAAAPASSASSSPQAQASIPAAQLTALGEKLRNDIASLLYAFRGAVHALTDGTGAEGDDGVIAVGSADQALVLMPDRTIRFGSAATAGDKAVQPLRHAVALCVDRLQKCLASHPDFQRDTVAISLSIHAAFRVCSGRGPKMFKTVNARKDMQNFKRFYREPLADFRTRHFSRVMWAVTLEQAGGAGSVACTTDLFGALGGTHQTARAYQLTRLLYHKNRRQAEALYAVPRALHWGLAGSSPSPSKTGSASANAQADPVSAIGEGGGDKDVEDGVEGAEVDLATSMAEIEADFAEAEAEQGTDTPMQVDTPAEPAPSGKDTGVDLRAAIPVFGRSAIDKLSPAEHPYVSMLSSTVRLVIHPYDSVRRTAGSHVFTMLSVFAWLKRGLQTSAIMRLDKLTNKVAASATTARATTLRSMADGVLSSLGGMPGGLDVNAIAALAASGQLPANMNPAALQALVQSASTNQTAPAGMQSLPVPSSSTGTVAGPAPGPLSHSTVFGLVMLGFSSAGGLISTWDGLERALRVLLRSSILIKGLPIDKHAEALASFGMAVAGLLVGWHTIPIPPAHPKAAQWLAIRERLLKHLLATAAPQAYTPDATTVGRSPALTGLPAAAGLVPMPLGSPLAAGSRRLVLQADGSKGPVAAPLPDGPLHWRYELMAGAFMSIILAPRPAQPCRLAIDTSKGVPPAHVPGVAHPHGHGLSEAEAKAVELTLASEPLWLWVLTNCLSDNVLLRMQAFDCLLQLLHNHQAARAQRIGPGPSALPRVHAVLTDPAYVSQFVVALSQDHSDRGDGAGTPSQGAVETMLAMPGMRELATPLECARAGVEYSRQPMSGGASSSWVHMLLFELIGQCLPQAIPVFIEQLAKLGQGANAAAAAGKSAVEGVEHSQRAAEVMDDESGAADAAAVGDTPKPSVALPAGTLPADAAVTGAGHDAATLRNRQTTVAEAFAGFMRVLSGQKAPVTCVAAGSGSLGAGDAAGAIGGVTYSLADASLPALASSVGLPASSAAFTPSLPWKSVDVDVMQYKLLSLVAPMWETVGLDWAEDWHNAIRYAMRQRHPSQAALMWRYIFASTTAAVEASGASADYPADYDSSGLESLIKSVAGPHTLSMATAGTSTAGPTHAAGAGTSGGNSSAFAAQVRWLGFAQSLIFEAFATEDGTGAAATLPGVTAAEENAAEFGLHADERALSGCMPVSASVAGSSPEAGPTACLLPSRLVATAMCRQLLPTLIRAVPHPYKACRQEISRTIMVIVECGWGFLDAGLRSPVVQPVMAGKAVSLPAITEPVSCEWQEWAPATMAAVLHLASAARVVSADVSASSTSSSAVSAAGGDEAVRDRNKWNVRVLETIIAMLNDTQGMDLWVQTPLVLVGVPVLLTAVTQPDRDLSKLCAHVANVSAHALSLAKASSVLYDRASTKSDPDAVFFKRVESLLASALPAYAQQAGSGGPGGQQAASEAGGAAPAGLASCRTATDILTRILEAYATTVEKDGKGAADDADEGAVATGAGAKKATATTVKVAPAALGSPIVQATPPIPRTLVMGGTGVPASAGTQWYVRRAALTMSVPIRARNLLWVHRQAEAVLLAATESRLDDKQIEVADAAGNTLVGFVMTMPSAERGALAARLLKLVNSKLPAKVAAPSSTADANGPEAEAFKKYKTRTTRQLRKRHAGVLGVAAVVRASPFDVPTYLPSLLSALSHHASDAAPVGPAVRDCVSEFRRTHQDNWEQHKQAFTEDQLTDIMNVTAAGSYFA